jgi:hypothetical protein
MALFEARDCPVGSVTLSQALREIVPFPVAGPLAVGPAAKDSGAPALALVADVRHLAIGDLLGLLHRAERSGLLLFGWRDHAKAVYLHRGEVVFAASNLAGDRIGESLVRSGALSLEALRLAERSFASGVRFGKVLVELGHVAPRELWHGVKFQVEEIVRSLFSYTDGAVYFFDGEVKPDNVVRLSLPTERLVAEGIQQREELRHFVELLGTSGVELVRIPGLGDGLEGAERMIYQALADERSFSGLLAQLDLDPRAAGCAIQMLRRLGAVRLRQPAGAPLAAGAADEGEALQRSLEAHLKLIAELSAPIVAAEGLGPLRERFARVLDEVAHRYPAVLAGVGLSPTGALEAGPLLARSQALSGDRLEQVRVALGELVSYLEFELTNHPGIEDAKPILSSAELVRTDL